MEEKFIMKEATRRSIFRWIHIICGIPILGYIYDSPTDTPNYAYSVCLFPRIADFRIVDVERLCCSTTYFEQNGLTSHSRRPLGRLNLINLIALEKIFILPLSADACATQLCKLGLALEFCRV
jgi:hypothetical protein